MVIFLSDVVFAVCILYFAQINNTVAAIDYQVDLSAGVARGTSPAPDRGGDALNPKRTFDLSDMPLTDLLKGITAPGMLLAAALDVDPKAFVIHFRVFHEVKIEKSEEIDKLVKRAPRSLSIRSINANETGELQFVKNFC